MDYIELFRGVEMIWLLWLTSLVLLGVTLRLVVRTLQNVKRQAVMRRLNWKRLHTDQRGATYSLSFILVFPFLVFLIALVIETTFILVTKIGTMHAAYAAARTGAVWSTGDTYHGVQDDGFISLAQSKAKQTAVLAMVPYSSGSKKNMDDDGKAQQYITVYNTIRGNSRTTPEPWYHKLDDEYIKNKYTYAVKTTHVELSLTPFKTIPGSARTKEAPWKQLVQAKVSYEYPFQVFPVGQALLGKKRSDGSVVYEIASTARINNECPRNEKGELGIRIVP